MKLEIKTHILIDFEIISFNNSWYSFRFSNCFSILDLRLNLKGDCMSFNYSGITHTDSIKIGSDDAPLKIVEYINLRCPDSKNYEENVAPFLNVYIKNGTVQRILKHFDKQKYPLEVGNVLNQYLDYSTPEETFNLVKKLFEEQEIWGKNRLSQIPHIAKEYDLSLQAENREQANRIDDEIKSVNVTNVPTVFVGEKAFVETIELDEFKEAVEDHFK